MNRKPPPRSRRRAFEIVRKAGLQLPDVEAETRYDGYPVLKLGGCFMAGLATHPSAEPHTLVVRAVMEDRDVLVDEAPEIYYLTDYYRKYPLVLARLPRLDEGSLRDLLRMSWRLTAFKQGKARRRTPRGAGR
jgi:hypothetical protein